MIISDFTQPEVDYLWGLCNFAGHEREVFRMRSEGIPLEKIAEEMNLSVDSIKRISRKVNTKIIKVLDRS